MCGIAGIIDQRGRAVDQSDLRKMTDAIRHRGPDGEGFYCHANVGFGHRRLAIIDLSDAGVQPMHYEGCWLTYNGEIYNYIELREELKKKGFRFHTATDSEVVLAAYKCWGTNCVLHFNGMWSFAIYDTKQQQVFFSRDRFGEKPFYYTQQDGRFIFCSEIKGLLEVVDQRKADMKSVTGFLVYEQSENPCQTFFDRIKKLAGGCNGIINLSSNELTITPYYLPAENDSWESASEPELINEFRNRLTNAVRIRLRSDVQVGTCLSGGIDSSAIAAIASNIHQQHSSIPFVSVTAGSIDPVWDETHFAKEVAGACGLKGMYTTPSAGDFQAAFSQVVSLQEEPIISASVFMQHFVMKAAGNAGIKVLLDGQGADELLLGYQNHIAQVLKMLPMGTALKLASDISRNNEISFWQLFQLVAYHAKPILKARRQLARWRIVESQAGKRWLNKSAFKELTAPAMAANDHLFDFQTHELTSSSLPALLRYEDKNAMAFSIETRLPFLDPAIVELTMNLPARILFKAGWSKYLLRKSMDGKLPDSVLWRKKKFGFVAPTSLWKGEDLFFSRMMQESPILQQLFGKVNVPENRNSMWRMLSIAAWEKELSVAI